GGHARHAAETAVEVRDGRVGELYGALDAPLHQPDPPARRVHLLLPERAVGREGGKAEAAVDAVLDQSRVDAHDRPRSRPGLSGAAIVPTTGGAAQGFPTIAPART